MTKTLIKFYPQMTSNTTPYLTTSSETYNATRLSWHAFDGNASTDWASKYVTGWLKINFLEQKKLSNIYIRGDATARYSPKNFTVQVSNDDVNWELAYTGTNITWNDNETKVFPIELAESGYRYYKINITANNTGLYSTITDIYFDELLPSNKTLILHDDEYKKFIPKTYFQPKDTNLVPIMTSNTTPKGKVSANYEADPAWGAFDDGTKSRSFWFSSDSGNPNNQWLQYEFVESRIVNKVSLQSLSVISGGNYGIKNFTILGSNDGVNYDVLFNGVHPNNSSEVFYDFPNKNSYKIYRIKGNSYNSDAQMLISSFKMFGDEVLGNPSHWSTVSSTLPTSTQFSEKGMDNLSPLLDRKATELEPLTMSDKSEILGFGETGKVFSKTIYLKKYFDIKSTRTEVK
ncbi:discoidin domain-containing protein [Lysinibacillus sp. CNPSo 3705]|uniref:discoidin domain-containing protein n=1 Tax=Lysinibacillus sp. CNPSo 3705 TaxID=3028148 RepID=UPI002363DEB8|nr:discoidin domain-containing protein [Lysinibacillus sp. CNPSo 3705]MDD1502592.1 discoidin domain-containing protein [Lysinibacillus sp. CNPSo 3705]